ncbi:hypothetical protein F5890DRAFT_1544201 [Lentinula detonsa]|uniref:Uncharacterized protein n=1 Tax=Lentinula detonsa TaxID=2804962 RepID=A0AA38PRG4_9AGAR|nr:hypothetical protein F5890DRAFT_1544201 [Lentinula detonsa]
MTITIQNSLELPLAQLMPAPLQFETPPSSIQHANSIPQFVKWNLKRVILADVHYEHQLYGPDNTYLHSIFPIHRNFSVIPQALLRRAIRTGRLSGLNVSTGSTGATHVGRDAGGIMKIKIYPDFLVVKVVPTSEDRPRTQQVVCVVEIKLGDISAVGDVDTSQAEAQMLEYMTTLINHPFRDPNLKGYLIVADKYLEFRIENNVVVYDPDGWIGIFSSGDPLTVALSNIAVAEWNRTTMQVAPVAFAMMAAELVAGGL